MTEEIWKPIKGYEGLYEISNYGRIKRVDIKVPTFKDTSETVISLCKNNIKKGYVIRELVAKHFIPQPKKCKYLISKDLDIYNAKIDNLMWSEMTFQAYKAKTKYKGSTSRVVADQISLSEINRAARDYRIDLISERF